MTEMLSIRFVRVVLIVSCVLATTLGWDVAAQQNPPTGFTPRGAEAELACEAKLQALPSSAAYKRHLEALTKEPHQTGGEANVRVAEYLEQAMKRAGLDVQTYPYDVYLPSIDTDIEIALVTPIRLPLNNQEYVLEEDRFSSHPDLKKGWNAFSGSGDVTAEVVYANFGRKEDFEQLRALGVSVKGKIVVARYGGNFRGFKAKYSEEHGAVGALIYTDPANNGYMAGPPYPEGRYLTESTIQRGSLLTLSYTGDPLTPFEPALPRDSGASVTRLDPADVALHTIPVAPIPYGSAHEILSRMKGEPVPEGWQGGLPFAYRLTGGEALTVRLRVDQPHGLVRATNVIGTIQGTEFPDEWVILGSHYDAWNFGACDPNSGSAMLLTLADALGEMTQDGCQPRRTIKIAHWDAEEYGIIGSTEWVEQFRDDLLTHAVAYINADGSVTGGQFSASAAPSLKGLFTDATKAVAHPKGGTVYEQWVAGSKNGSSPAMGNLGGGSDHVGFYTHVGVPSGGMSFRGSTPNYHSNYDTFAWYERFADTEFVFGPTLSRIDGVATLRLANADVLPYDVVRYSRDLETHIATLEKRAKELEVAADLSGLRGAVKKLSKATRDYVKARDRRLSRKGVTGEVASEINSQLIALEKAFLYQEGLQGRPWSRSLYASPDPFSGYASWMLPGLRYEIETRGSEIASWEKIYVAAVSDLTSRIGGVTRALR